MRRENGTYNWPVRLQFILTELGILSFGSNVLKIICKGNVYMTAARKAKTTADAAAPNDVHERSWEQARYVNQVRATRAAVVTSCIAAITSVVAILGFISLNNQKKIENKLVILKELTPNLTIVDTKAVIQSPGNPGIQVQVTNNSQFIVKYQQLPGVEFVSCRTGVTMRASDRNSSEIMNDRAPIWTLSPNQTTSAYFTAQILNDVRLLEEITKENDPVFAVYRVIAFVENADMFEDFIISHGLQSRLIYSEDSQNENPLIYIGWTFYGSYERVDGEMVISNDTRCIAAFQAHHYPT